VDSVPDPLLLRKSGSAGNRTQGLCMETIYEPHLLNLFPVHFLENFHTRYRSLHDKAQRAISGIIENGFCSSHKYTNILITLNGDSSISLDHC
jgi:hypothetical protein